MIYLIKNEIKKISLLKLFFPIIIFVFIMYLIYISKNKESNLIEIYNYIPFIGIVNSILFSGIICNEITSGSFRFYLTKPVSRIKIIISKFIIINLYSIIILLVIFVLKCLISNYFNMDILLLYFKYSISILLINSLIIFLSIINKNSTINCGILIFLITFGYTISQILFLVRLKIVKYTFLPYIDLSIFKGDLYSFFDVSVNRFVLISLFYSTFFFLTSIFLFNKKDIKC